jgi:hypothetical protein
MRTRYRLRLGATVAPKLGPEAGEREQRPVVQPMSRRIRAAIAALPFEHPKLSVNANVGGNVGWGANLERAIEIARERKPSHWGSP